jgi:hypothetical protein
MSPVSNQVFINLAEQCINKEPSKRLEKAAIGSDWRLAGDGAGGEEGKKKERRGQQ